MAKAVRIKRRITGAAGPPSTLLNAELAFNEISGVLYYGKGLAAGTTAATIIAIGGSGAFVDLVSAQTIAGGKTFSGAVSFTGSVSAPTPPISDNSAAVATTSFVKSQNYVALVDGLIPASVLPSYVDDVLEYSTFSDFPAVGETGKIYVTLDRNKTYRWSGSVYVEIASSPGSTDVIAEGSQNLYFTPARAAAASPVQSVAGKIGAVQLTTSDIGGLTAALAQKISRCSRIDGGLF
jgi:hypothetical protein